MIKNKLYIIGALSILTILVACTKDQKNGEDGFDCDAMDRSSEVVALFETKCNSAGCHAGGHEPDFRIKANIEASAASGDLERVLLIAKTMPLNGSLTSDEKALMRCWLHSGGKISDGAIDTSNTNTDITEVVDFCDSLTISYSNDIAPIITSSCAGNSACHGSGSNNGDFVDTDTIWTFITNGSFKSEVITEKTMPVGSSLSDLQLQIIECWLDAGAVNDSEDACDSISFATHIEPIFTTSCAVSSGCHGSGTGLSEFTSYANIKTAVDAGTIKDRVLVRKDMPPGGSLSDQKLQFIQCWLDAGAPNN